MAEKRMFSIRIVDSDAFLDMPLSTQALYFHLGMRADDDGFINNHNKIRKIIGASEDDIKLLIAKSFIIMFESGVIVVKHWHINNYQRGDRKKSTTYTKELEQLEIKKNDAYTLKTMLGVPTVNQMSGTCQHRIDKIRLDENRIDTIDHQAGRVISSKTFKSKEELTNEFEMLWKLYPRKIGKQKSLKKYLEYSKKEDQLFDKVKVGIENYLDYIKINKIETAFIKHAITYFNNQSWLDDYSTAKLKSKKEVEKPIWYEKHNQEIKEYAKKEPTKLTDEEKETINNEAKSIFQ